MIVLGIASGLCVAGCDGIREPLEVPGEHFVGDARLQVPGELPAVSLSILKTAEFRMPEALVFSGGRWTVQRTSVHAAVLVRHPQGAFLFDAGLGTHAGAHFADAMPFWLRPLMQYTQHVPAKRALGAEAGMIGRIILSHMHWDHVGGVEDFPQAEVLAGRKDYELATGGGAAHALFVPGQIDEANPWRLVDFTGGAYENFDRSQDLFGDGTVVLVPLPGHTPGALGMFVNLRSGKRFFFVGDAVWAIEGFRIPAPKFWVSRLLVDHDSAETERSLLRVARLMRHDPDLIVVPAHDEAVQRAIGFYPVVVR